MYSLSEVKVEKQTFLFRINKTCIPPSGCRGIRLTYTTLYILGLCVSFYPCLAKGQYIQSKGRRHLEQICSDVPGWREHVFAAYVGLPWYLWHTSTPLSAAILLLRGIVSIFVRRTVPCCWKRLIRDGLLRWPCHVMRWRPPRDTRVLPQGWVYRGLLALPTYVHTHALLQPQSQPTRHAMINGTTKGLSLKPQPLMVAN